MNKSNLFLATLITVGVAAVVITALWRDDNNQADRFSVNGSGTVYAKADIANLQVGFKTEVKKTAAEATADSSKKMNDIIAAIKALGIKEDDIQTIGYNLNPVYNWTQDKGQELSGYEVNQNVALKIRDLSKIGEVIAKTTEKGANQLGNINFTIDDEFALRNQARELAIKKAQEKAELIAKQSGMKLGKIKGVFEVAAPSYPPMEYSNAKMLATGRDLAEAVPAADIQSGQNEIKVEVTLVYEVK